MAMGCSGFIDAILSSQVEEEKHRQAEKKLCHLTGPAKSTPYQAGSASTVCLNGLLVQDRKQDREIQARALQPVFTRMAQNFRGAEH
jgi:hypothetical protein